MILLGRWALPVVCGGLWATSAWAALPDADVVQRAYEQARQDADSNPQHVYDLKVLAARCSSLPGADQFMCQIDFVRKDQPQGRLYFEVVTLADNKPGWTLLSGLCKTRPPKRGS